MRLPDRRKLHLYNISSKCNEDCFLTDNYTCIVNVSWLRGISFPCEINIKKRMIAKPLDVKITDVKTVHLK